MTRVDVLTIKTDKSYVSSLRTRNSTREKNNIQVLQIKIFVESFFVIYCSESQAAFAICIAREILCFKSYLLWVPQCICLGSYKACSKKLLCWGRPHPESQKLAVEKDAHHLLSLYTCNFFALTLQRQPYQGYKQTRH